MSRNGCLLLFLTASGACGVIPVRHTLGAWVGRVGIWTRKLKFICLWNSESRICGSVTILTPVQVFSRVSTSGFDFTLSEQDMFTTAVPAVIPDSLHSDSQKRLTLTEIWFLVSTCCVALASCLTILHCSAYCTKRWWRAQEKVTEKVPRACPCCPCLAEQ